MRGRARRRIRVDSSSFRFYIIAHDETYVSCRAVGACLKALEKAGFRVDRQSKHLFMSKGEIKVVVPRNNPVDAYTMAAIVRDAGMSIEEFKDLL